MTLIQSLLPLRGGRRPLALLAALAAVAALTFAAVGPFGASAQESNDGESAEAVALDSSDDSDNAVADAVTLTTLTVDGAASRSVAYDGAVAHFTISVLADTVLAAANAGNAAAAAIAAAVDEQCTEGEPDNADHTAAPTCISPDGLQTTSIRIGAEYDWTEQGRVLRGYRYENGLSIAVRGTGFAGGLVDLVITAGGDDVRFDDLAFTSSRRAETERLALLDAIDDAQATAASIAKHMDYRIVRVVEVRPAGGVSPRTTSGFAAERVQADEDFTPTPVFGGSETVASSVQIVYELAPIPNDALDGGK